MIKTIPLTCPKCGAELNVDEKLTQCFCQYCGAKMMIDKGETVFVVRDEARILEAEIRERIRREEIEQEEKADKKKEKDKKKSIIILLVLTIADALMLTIGRKSETLLVIGCFLALFLFISYLVLFGGFIDKLSPSKSKKNK